MNATLTNLRKVAETSVGLQQELFRTWASLWPQAPVSAFPITELQKFQKKWIEIIGELFQRQNDSLAIHFGAGLETIEEVFHLAEAKDAEELRNKTIKLWQKTFAYLQQASQAQLRDFQNAVSKWTELMNRGREPVSPPFRVPVVRETKANEEKPSKPVMPKSDREELKEAMQEYEMTRGDWAKDR
jgi:hypothetical protein